MDYDLDFFSYYFEKQGSNRNNQNTTSQSVNTLPVWAGKIIPDGIASFQTGERRVVFLFEQHNGKDTKRALKQLYGHAQALVEGSASQKYDYQAWVKVFFVFEHESCMKAVIDRFMQDEAFLNFESYFLFKSNRELGQDFFSDWHRASGELEDFVYM